MFEFLENKKRAKSYFCVSKEIRIPHKFVQVNVYN